MGFKADISIAIDPLSVLKAKAVTPSGPLSPLNVGAAFTSSPCAFTLHNDTSIYSLSQIIRDARTIGENGRQVNFFYFSFVMCSDCFRNVYKGLLFYLAAQASLSFLMLLSYCMLLPPILTGYQLMWVLWVVMPPLALSFLFSPHDPQVMTTMPGKSRSARVRRFTIVDNQHFS